MPHYSRVRYRGVYDGVDLVYHSQEGQLEYDFVVAPGASPTRFACASRARRHSASIAKAIWNLTIGGSTLRHQAPFAYQEIDGRRYPVTAEYVVRNGGVGFRTGAYDPSLPLIIDPVVVYSTYIGGQRTEVINAVAVDKDGNTYITGETTSSDFPQAGTPLSHPSGAVTYGFVTKINPAGNQVIYSSFIGGGANTTGTSIAVDAAQNVYLGGVTGARDFPLVNPVQSTQPGLNIGYVMKINPQGDKLLLSTYLGGERNDRVDALAIDGAGSIYITGYTSSVAVPRRECLPAEDRRQFRRVRGEVRRARLPPGVFELPRRSRRRRALRDRGGWRGRRIHRGLHEFAQYGDGGRATSPSSRAAAIRSWRVCVPRAMASPSTRTWAASGDDHAQAIALEANGNILVGGLHDLEGFSGDG